MQKLLGLITKVFCAYSGTPHLRRKLNECVTSGNAAFFTRACPSDQFAAA
jgi:hypothetical protein